MTDPRPESVAKVQMAVAIGVEVDGAAGEQWLMGKEPTVAVQIMPCRPVDFMHRIGRKRTAGRRGRRCAIGEQQRRQDLSRFERFQVQAAPVTSGGNT